MLVLNTLKKHFVFDRIFNLLHYADNMHSLQEELKKLARNSYTTNYRFIFLHYDTDYHIGSQPGFILVNLQRILQSLAIPNYFCLILTQKNLAAELEQIRIQESNDECAIGYIQHNLQDLLHFPNTHQSIDPFLIEKKYICLNNVRRCHRTLLFALLRDKNLLDDGLVSYCSKNKK